MPAMRPDRTHRLLCNHDFRYRIATHCLPSPGPSLSPRNSTFVMPAGLWSIEAGFELEGRRMLPLDRPRSSLGRLCGGLPLLQCRECALVAVKVILGEPGEDASFSVWPFVAEDGVPGDVAASSLDDLCADGQLGIVARTTGPTGSGDEVRAVMSFRYSRRAQLPSAPADARGLCLQSQAIDESGRLLESIRESDHGEPSRVRENQLHTSCDTSSYASHVHTLDCLSRKQA